MQSTIPLILLAVAASTIAGGMPETPHHARVPVISPSARLQATGAATACAMITKTDVDAAFAPRVFGVGEKGVGDFVGTAKLASVSSCVFTSRGTSSRDMLSVGLLVRRAPSDQAGVSLATAKDGAVKLKLTPVDVPGLGAAAYWVNMGSAARPIIQLNVLKGKRTWLIYSASAAGLQTDKALADLTKVARSTLGRL